MQSILSSLKQSASLKVLIIGALILLLLIPMVMIRDVISERQQTGVQARYEVMRAWGREQVIAGPIFILPYEMIQVTQYGERVVSENVAYILPETIDIKSMLMPEVRYRGLYQVPVYTADVTITGSVKLPAMDELGLETAHLKWDHSSIALAISDARAITTMPSVLLDGQAYRFGAGGQQVDGLPPQIVAEVGEYFSALEMGDEINFEIAFRINGTDGLKFLPLGDTTTVAAESIWTSPSFAGNYLPQSREITDNGFTAQWQISSLGRELPSHWTQGQIVLPEMSKLQFGVNLFMPVGFYQKTERATKYAVLFFGLTFAAYFLFEIVAGLRLHPLQYLLVGFGNTIFYLLLLSLAEHIGFGWAYLVSAIASSGLIVAYSRAALGQRQRAVAISVVLVCLYSYLYMTLQAESFAMLAGAIGLWFSLAITMYLTRKVDWYGETADTTDRDPITDGSVVDELGPA